MSTYGDVTFLICNARSRSAWMAEVFSHVAVASMHDPLRFMTSIAGDFKNYVDGLCCEAEARNRPVFIADSGASFFTSRIEEVFTGARFLFIIRDPQEVRASLSRIGVSPYPDPKEILARMRMDHDRFSARGIPCMAKTVDHLSDYDEFKRILMFACRATMSKADHTKFDALNIQCDMRKHMKDVDYNNLETLMKESTL